MHDIPTIQGKSLEVHTSPCTAIGNPKKDPAQGEEDMECFKHFKPSTNELIGTCLSALVIVERGNDVLPLVS